ncbi:MAG: MFS transporter [Pseudomonadota bacterium]
MKQQALKVRALMLLVAAEVMGMSLWFAAAAVLPALKAEFLLSPTAAAVMTSAVSAGFVFGTLGVAVTGLADRMNPRALFAIAAVCAALSNFALLFAAGSVAAMVLTRFAVGAFSAGVYPIGMKLAAAWAKPANAVGKSDTGLLVGLLVGALTLGSALPHLIDIFGGLSWRTTIQIGSLAALAAAGLILLFPMGPGYKGPTVPPGLQWGALARAWTYRPLRLANLGYLGHMWELYAMWAWIGSFLIASFTLNPGGESAVVSAKWATFAIVAAGALGAVYGGRLADRFGRTALTMGAMITSAACALFFAFNLGAAPVLLVAVGLVWGVSVIADSAQFSASVIELSPPELTGTMLTLQTAQGFLLTILTIQGVPLLLERGGWPLAFSILAIGPLLGAIAMARLRGLPEAKALAGGRR